MSIWSGIKKVGSSMLSGLGKAVTGIPKSIIGGALDIGTSWLGNELISKPNAEDAYEMSKEATAKAFERSYGAYKRRYQDTVADMYSAGLNPILAASGGFGIGQNPQVSTAQAYRADPLQFEGTRSSQQAARSDLSYAEEERTKDERLELLHKARFHRQKVKESVQKITNMRAEKRLITQNERKVVQEVSNLEKEWWILVQKFYKTTYEAGKAFLEQDKIVAQTRQLITELAKMKKISKVYDGPAGAVLSYVKEILDSFNINVGIIPIVGGKGKSSKTK